MGTKTTLQYKYARAYEIMHAALVHGCDVDKEKALATLMTSCFCERRKAMEVLNAQAISLNFKEDKVLGKSTYLNPKVSQMAPKEELELLEKGDANAEQTIC